MPARSALVVDDSKLALMTLRRMLQAHGVTVETAESAEEALDYLRGNIQPGVVFMDHMMPGMDGLQAVQAMKSDPHTAMIPVVMYTSKDGEAYSEQARALGAVGLLSKPASPAELANVLRRLGLLAEAAHGMAGAAHAEGAGRGGTPGGARVMSFARAAPAASGAAPADAGSGQGPGPWRDRAMPDAASPDVPHAVPVEHQRAPAAGVLHRYGGALKFALFALVLLLPAFWYLNMYLEAEKQRLKAIEENLVLKAERDKAKAEDENAKLLETIGRQRLRAIQENSALLETIAWAVNINSQYDYEQLALGDERLNVVREIVSRLALIGFKGVLRLETHTGEFCLVRNEFGQYKLPGDDLPISGCEVVSYAPDQAVALGLRQSPAFGRYLSTEPSINQGDMRVEVVSRGKDRPLYGYPYLSTLQTAGEWNRVARRNNRVEISIIPASR